MKVVIRIFCCENILKNTVILLDKYIYMCYILGMECKVVPLESSYYVIRSSEPFYLSEHYVYWVDRSIRWHSSFEVAKRFKTYASACAACSRIASFFPFEVVRFSYYDRF
ncbi:hypothetical protein [Sigmofec virus UA08Rod_5530]|uniref:Uncharacterized protein n=1 Tax=Sigmofec virus UA08Rod_5530 TaxID=2929427 RepID=A0A976N256_9VIRU|nr:hypothetical protein [Sigmofec virus UA08Rod_5530]